MSKVEITVDELHAYLQCPAKYMFKHQKGLKEVESDSILFKKAIHKTIDFFFFSLMNNQMPTLAAMKEKWENTYTEFLGKREFSHILETRPAIVSKKKTQRKSPDYIKGLEMIYTFYQLNSQNPGVPIAVDHEYRVAIGEIIVRGKFELIRETLDPVNGSRYVEIVDFKTNDKPIEYMLVKHDINLLLASYAFRELFQAKEDRMKYHYLPTGRDIIIEKKDDDFKRLESIISGVGNSIKNEYFYPRQSFMCRSCELKSICDITEF